MFVQKKSVKTPVFRFAFGLLPASRRVEAVQVKTMNLETLNTAQQGLQNRKNLWCRNLAPTPRTCVCVWLCMWALPDEARKLQTCHLLLLYFHRTRQSSQSSSHQRGGLHRFSVLAVSQRGSRFKHGHRLPEGKRGSVCWRGKSGFLHAADEARRPNHKCARKINYSVAVFCSCGVNRLQLQSREGKGGTKKMWLTCKR